ncbi:hypothetical protein POM88_032650 [Heracleum sosnowskyi]|uniref:Uncharacterized protein n=1 Tax=Heracleum sosnowskyi TaxID=360622 RepID=A0AAD8MKU5_9APIA|nr:hypothetical protein POM88_032650 [Heracleum sosnowskyi]
MDSQGQPKPEYVNFRAQVGVSDKQRVLQRKLNKIAENTDTSTLEGLDYILKETVRGLPQQDNSDHSSCNYYSYIFEKYDTLGSLSKDFKEVIDKFDKFVKDEEVFVNVDGVKYQKKGGMVKAKRGIDNEYTLATICVLASCEHRTPVKREEKGEYVHFFAVLQTLQRIPKKDIESVRVMWTPQKEDEILTEEDLRRQTNLMPIVNGRVFLIS